MVTTSDIEHKLNYLYSSNHSEYDEHLDMIKSLGYRVFRNSNGKHIIKINEQHLNEAFGGIFGKIFGGD